MQLGGDKDEAGALAQLALLKVGKDQVNGGDKSTNPFVGLRDKDGKIVPEQMRKVESMLKSLGSAKTAAIAKAAGFRLDGTRIDGPFAKSPGFGLDGSVRRDEFNPDQARDRNGQIRRRRQPIDGPKAERTLLNGRLDSRKILPPRRPWGPARPEHADADDGQSHERTTAQFGGGRRHRSTTRDSRTTEAHTRRESTRRPPARHWQRRAQWARHKQRFNNHE